MASSPPQQPPPNIPLSSPNTPLSPQTTEESSIISSMVEIPRCVSPLNYWYLHFPPNDKIVAAGYLAHEFLTKGTVLGKKIDPNLIRWTDPEEARILSSVAEIPPCLSLLNNWYVQFPQLQAGRYAHEFLTKGTLFGKKFDPNRSNPDSMAELPRLSPRHSSMAELARAVPVHSSEDWSEEEQRLFLLGIREHGADNWDVLATEYVKTKTPSQISQHATKILLGELQPKHD